MDPSGTNGSPSVRRHAAHASRPSRRASRVTGRRYSDRATPAAPATATPATHRSGSDPHVGGRSFSTSHGLTTDPALSSAPTTSRAAAPHRSASTGHTISTGDPSSTCPLNIAPTPSTSPAASHQSSDASSVAAKNGGSTHPSHCGHTCPSTINDGSNQMRIAAISPAAHPRCSAGIARIAPQAAANSTATPAHCHGDSHAAPFVPAGPAGWTTPGVTSIAASSVAVVPRPWSRSPESLRATSR